MSADINVVVEPDGNTAGVGVVHDYPTGAPFAEIRVLQLWPNGDADVVHVGDREDARELIKALEAAIEDGETNAR